MGCFQNLHVLRVDQVILLSPLPPYSNPSLCLSPYMAIVTLQMQDVDISWVIHMDIGS